MRAARIDKSDRATVEQAIDPKTRMVLFKMLNRGLFAEINGCVSTGKEANVYHATQPDGTDLAIKIYKTSVLVFKDRDRYVSGDYRRVSLARPPARPPPALPPRGAQRQRWPARSPRRCLAALLATHAAPSPSALPPTRRHRHRHHRAQLPQRLLPLQPAQDGQDVGGEGAAKPVAPQGGRHPDGRAAAAAHPRARHGVHRHRRRRGAAAARRGAAAGAAACGLPRAHHHRTADVRHVPARTRRPERVQHSVSRGRAVHHRRLAGARARWGLSRLAPSLSPVCRAPRSPLPSPKRLSSSPARLRT